jgi:hypothetical protein
MYCKYCEEANKKNTYTVGCKNFRISDIQKHSRSRDHAAAAEACLLKVTGATVTNALSKVMSLNEKAVMAAMRNLYWLAKEDVASLKYNALNELTKLQGCDSIDHLFVGENAKYTSPEVVREMQLSISSCIKDDIQKELLQSPVYGILTDEATDISTTSSLIVYTHYINNGIRKLRFLADIELSHCDARSLFTVILNVLEDYGVSSNKCLGFGSDGASVMTGRENGVAALLKRVNPYLLSIHCVAHRLSLASSQAASGITTIAQYRKTLSALYGHFSHSTVKNYELREIQKVLDEPEIKLKKLYDVRWLSFQNVVGTVRRTLTSFFVYFENVVEQEGDATAIGIHRAITTYSFLALTHFLDDVLSILSKLSLNFQRQNLDISLVQPKVTAAFDVIKNTKVHDGPNLSQFKNDYDNGVYALYNAKDCVSQRSSFDVARQNYLSKLESNLIDRFIHSSILNSFRIVNPMHFPATVELAAKFGVDDLEVIIEHFCKPTDLDDCPPLLNAIELRSEFQMFVPFVIRNFPQTNFYQFATMFLNNFSDMYPQMATLISIALIIPVSTAPCERGFSAINRIKTKLRNRLHTSTVDTLLRISVEGPPISQFDFGCCLDYYEYQATLHI